MTRSEFKAAYSPKTVAHAKHDVGLFVWRGDGRYQHDAALTIYKSEKVAQKAADKMNAAGEHGGMVVVRLNAAIERLIRAALDQRQPSRRLKRTLNDVLDLIDHPLSLRHGRQWRRRQER